MRTKRNLVRVCFFGLVLLALPAWSQTEFTYTTNAGGGSITITGCNVGTNILVIPANIGGRVVTSIGDSAFFDNALLMNLTTVTIPDTVTSIGDSAFLDMNVVTVAIPNSVTNIGVQAFGNDFYLVNVAIPTNIFNLGESAFQDCGLPSVIIPDVCTNIGAYAFYGCDATNVTIGKGVVSIGDQAFSGCPMLPAFTVAASNLDYSSLNGVLFNKNQSTLIQFPGGRAGPYTVPDTVTNFGDQAFSFSADLTGVTIPNGVTSIGNMQFYGCSSLTDLSIPDSVTGIETNAFYYCWSLTNVTIPASVTNIAFSAFAECYDLQTVTMGTGLKFLGDQVFVDDTALAGIYFQGNAPALGGTDVFFNVNPAGAVYYFAGTTGWSTMFGGLPTVQIGARLTISDTGLKDDIFGFTINGTSNLVVLVEACTNLVKPIWSPVATNTLTEGSSSFSDPQWTNYHGRFYRVVSQ
jgi:hypothetical protein